MQTGATRDTGGISNLQNQSVFHLIKDFNLYERVQGACQTVCGNTFELRFSLPGDPMFVSLGAAELCTMEDTSAARLGGKHSLVQTSNIPTLLFASIIN